jgi:polyisoprenoid-binding protein YceI
MKKTFIFASLATAILVLGSCGSNATEAGNADSAAQASAAAVTYKIDAATSTLGWHGSKVAGVGEHSGTIAIQEGTLSVENGNITAGTFVIDMAKIVVTDSGMPQEYKDKLVGHFSADDFFNSAKFPTSKFEISACEAKTDGDNTHFITGNLTLRDSTKSISFPAKVAVTETGITADAKVTINRLDWGINYDKDNMSLNEKAQAKLKNGVVGKDIELTISLKGNK